MPGFVKLTVVVPDRINTVAATGHSFIVTGK